MLTVGTPVTPEQEWLWKGRHVYMFDGTTVLMPDTAANQQACPQTWNQKAGAGLAYNLIRTIMAQAASKHALPPRSISFTGTLQTLEAFQPMIAMQGNQISSSRWLFYEQLLDAIVKHRVADRPDRIEPRRIKRRHKHYVPLSVPRAEAKRQILKGLSKNSIVVRLRKLAFFGVCGTEHVCLSVSTAGVSERSADLLATGLLDGTE